MDKVLVAVTVECCGRGTTKPEGGMLEVKSLDLRARASVTFGGRGEIIEFLPYSAILELPESRTILAKGVGM